jgi:hypothetical protein
MEFYDNARHPLLAEGDQHTPAYDWFGALWDTVGENHVQRHRQGDVAEFRHWLEG